MLPGLCREAREHTGTYMTKYIQVMRDIKASIINGGLRPGDKLKGEAEYMQTYSVSSITIRKAMDGLAQEGYLRRVKGKGSFVSDKWQSGYSKRVAVIMPFIGQPDISLLKIQLGIQKYLNQIGYSLIVDWYDSTNSAEKSVIDKVIDQHVEGILYYSMDPAMNRALFDDLERKNIPFVCIDRYDIFRRCNYAGSNNYSGGALAARRLLDMGHKKLRYLSLNFSLSSERERYDGFCSVLQREGIDFGPGHILQENDFEKLAGEIRGGQITGIFCANDFSAMKLIEGLKKLDIQTPRDLSVVGFDKWAGLDHTGLNLTTIRQDFYAIGMAAAKLLFELISGPDTAIPVHILTSVELVAGDTVAAPRKQSR
jgi:DNA-binding LacI/PurR family transcriptional regulator